MTTPRAASRVNAEAAPLLSSRPGGAAPHGRGHRPGMRFLGLLLWQWGLVALGAVLLYLLYIVGASFAWRKGGKRYHVVMITLGCISGVRALLWEDAARREAQPRGVRRNRAAHVPAVLTAPSLRPGVWSTSAYTHSVPRSWRRTWTSPSSRLRRALWA